MEWIISANHNKYDHDKSFEDFGFIDWRQVASFSIGDTVYIYNTKPYSKCKCQYQSEPLYWCEIEPPFNSSTSPLFL